MKTTTWLCPVFTLLCATKLVYTAQRGVSYGSYPATDGLDTSMLQNDYILAKRNKPSLSIVNPLDVLRQRLLLEIARRQMKENTRQVELNRAILKNVGKRMLNKHPYALESTATQWDPLNMFHSQNHQQQQQHQLPTLQHERAMHLQPYDLELIPSTLIFDYLQQRRPWSTYERTAAPVLDINDMDFNDNVDDGEGGDVGAESDDEDVVIGLGGSNDIKLAMQPFNGHKAEYDGQHKSTVKKPINRRGLESEGGSNDDKVNVLAPLKHQKTFNNDYKLNDLTTLELNEAAAAMAKDSNSNKNLNDIHNNSDSDNMKNSDNDESQVQRFLYHLHKNHLTRK